MTRQILTLAAILALSACARQPVHHGLSPDGYGVTTNSSHLPPPADLMAPAHS
ncbi:hypothetical protein [Gluconobacter wancherniae]|uniref:hypothetical protein n=1 Tax=Gluconobacter wancherniae TaxID=1307955 RepID=UPI001B8BB2E1|nr:hypothetical protein [Gluconobacter wancherniae]MBS1088668.1 hypothetical protein [Gluconobacter wancherniae]